MNVDLKCLLELDIDHKDQKAALSDALKIISTLVKKHYTNNEHTCDDSINSEANASLAMLKNNYNEIPLDLLIDRLAQANIDYTYWCKH